MMRVNAVRSFTTRPHRKGSRSDHTHLSDERFDAYMTAADVVSYTEFDGYRYFTDRDMVDDADLFIVDPAGVRQLESEYTGRPIYEVYISASETSRKERMRARGDSEESAAQRITHDRKAFNGWGSVNSDGGVFMRCADRLYINNADGRLNDSVLKLVSFITEHWPQKED